jgi:peptidoglycan/xylan/chitin deacetylase (PgdA/CDA1 family)
MMGWVKKSVLAVLAGILFFGMTIACGKAAMPVYAADDMQVTFALDFNGGGWSKWSPDNRRIYSSRSYPTAFKALLNGQPSGMTGTVQYTVNVSGYGWTAIHENGDADGNDSSTGIPLEGARIWLNGNLADNYDIYYKAMVLGEWQDWAMNGDTAGEVGVGKHIDGIRVAVVKKGEMPAENQISGNVDPSRPMVALTFDDGPSSYDARTLAALEAVGGRATFFMVGNLVGAHADIVQRMAADGCELGNHSWDHADLEKLSEAEIQSSIARTSQAVADVTGQGTTVVRPPYGAVNATVKAALANMGYASILWHIDTLDWKTKNTQNTVNVVLSQVQDGDIVLMHSIYSASAAAAEQIIPALVQRGYQLVTVSELANARGGMTPGVNYGKFRP